MGEKIEKQNYSKVFTSKGTKRFTQVNIYLLGVNVQNIHIMI